MKNLFLAVLVGGVIYSCGDAGIGFNVGKEFPIEVPIEIPIPGNPLGGLIDIDPDAETFKYDLNEVGAFDGALDGLDDVGSIVVNGIAFEIEGVDADEQLDLDELRLDINLPSGVLSFQLATGDLQNLPKTSIALTQAQKESIVDELFNSKQLDSEVVIDFGSIPSDPNDRTVTIDFTAYFDILLKARDL
ncbi:MAG: hypothetical protein RIA69_13440 [Cyclobacteriaceae bacterium]